MALTAGTRLGPYEILAPIGTGGMGEVYKARDTRLGRDVAIKILNTAALDSEQMHDRFDRELKSVAKLSHVNIVTLYDVAGDGDVLFAVMELINELGKFNDDSGQGQAVVREAIEGIVIMLSPMVPHITQQLWNELGHDGLLADVSWPECDESAMVRDEIELVVQVNGKLRSKINVPADADKDSIEAAALADAKIQTNIEGKTVRKVIVVPGRLVNIVAN